MSSHFGTVENQARPTGIWISLLSFPFGVFFATSGLAVLWHLFRELLCRVNYESTHILYHWCYYDDFRRNGAIIYLTAPILYTIIPFWLLRRVSRRTHVLTLISLGIVWVLINAAATFAPRTMGGSVGSQPFDTQLRPS